MVNEYCKSLLNCDAQLIYDEMVVAFTNLQLEVEFKSDNQKDVFDAYIAVYHDHAELFYLSPQPRLMRKMSMFGSTIVFCSEFIYSEQEIHFYRHALQRVLTICTQLVKYSRNQAQTVQLICEYLMRLVRYEIDYIYNQNAVTVLLKNKGQCSGISKAVKLIFDHLGVECLVVTGSLISNGVVEPHNWNIIKIDGAYYHLDLTNLLGLNPQRRKPFNYSKYYNCADEQILRSHQWDRRKYPICTTSLPLPRTAAQQPEFPTVSTYAEFRQQIAAVLKKREEKYAFFARIPENDAQTLLKTLLSEMLAESNICGIDGFSVSISSQEYVGEILVEILIEWLAE